MEIIVPEASPSKNRNLYLQTHLHKTPNVIHINFVYREEIITKTYTKGMIKNVELKKYGHLPG